MQTPSGMDAPPSSFTLDLSPFDPLSSQPDPQPAPSTRLSKLKPTFAVDVSGSTRVNGALEAEKVAIDNICDLLEDPRNQSEALVLPWNHEPLPQVARKDMVAQSGFWEVGWTKPAAIFRSDHNIHVLRKSPVWFLMTDGCIEEKHLTMFTNDFRKCGVHGIAAVVIVFGHTNLHPSPSQCNVSVGVSVYGIAPHTIFLFHDIDTGILSVFGAKGRFSDLLPQTRRHIQFIETTRWEDLCRITYEDLVQAEVPLPELLDRDVIKLPNNRKVNMRSLYDYKMPAAELHDYLGSNDALDAFIISAKSTGQEKELSNVLKRTVEQGAFSSSSNADLSIVYLRSILQDAFEAGGSDQRQPNAMWLALQSQTFTKKIDIESMKASLRQEHIRTRARFKACQRSAQSIELLEEFSHQPSVPAPGPARPPAPWLTSPSCLAPTHSYAIQSSPTLGVEEDVSSKGSATMDFVSIQTGSSATLNRFTPVGSIAGHASYNLPPQNPGPLALDHSFLLKDYIFDPNTVANYHLSQCCLCGEAKTLQMFMLRSPGPRPRGRSSQDKPPQAFIFPMTSCDACLETLKKMPTLPNGEKVNEGIPCIPLTNGTNHHIWIRSLRNFVEHDAIHKSLEPGWFGQFLNFPLDNFVRLVELIAMFFDDTTAWTQKIRLFVWKKFLYELVKAQLQLPTQSVNGSRQQLKKALGYLYPHVASPLAPTGSRLDGLKRTAVQELPSSGQALTPEHTRTYQELQGTHLLPRDSILSFNRLEKYFEPISSGRCDYALGVFLSSMVAKWDVLDKTDNLDAFNTLRGMKEQFNNLLWSRNNGLVVVSVHNIYQEPELVTASDADKLIQMVRKYKTPTFVSNKGVGPSRNRHLP